MKAWGRGADVAVFEFITDGDGVANSYDINTNKNYSSYAYQHAGISTTVHRQIFR